MKICVVREFGPCHSHVQQRTSSLRSEYSVTQVKWQLSHRGRTEVAKETVPLVLLIMPGGSSSIVLLRHCAATCGSAGKPNCTMKPGTTPAVAISRETRQTVQVRLFGQLIALGYCAHRTVAAFCARTEEASLIKEIYADEFKESLSSKWSPVRVNFDRKAVSAAIAASTSTGQRSSTVELHIEPDVVRTLLAIVA